MTTIFATTIDQCLQATRLPKIACNNQNSVRLHVDFDAAWSGYGKTAVFYTSKDATPYKKVLSSDGNCLVPPEVLVEEATLYIGVEGVNANTRERKASTVVGFKILAGTPTMVVSDPTPSQYEQIVTAYGETNEAIAEESRERAAEIAAERASRAQEVAAERARIDNIVALKNGSTTGDAELADIRVGAGGETYASAGTAVRSQFSIVSNELRLNNDAGCATFAAYAGWQIGGMMSAQPTTHKNRIVSGNIMYFDRNIKIKIAEGFRIGVHAVTAEGEFLSDSNWRQEIYSVAAGTHFKIVIARVTEDNTETANIAEFSAAVTFTTYASEEVTSVKKTVLKEEELVRHIADSKCIDLKGSYFTKGGSGLPNNRIHADDLVCEGLAVVTLCDPSKDFFYGVDLFTNDGRRAAISLSGWMRTLDMPTFIVAQNCVMDISISKISADSFDDISEMDGLFKVYTYDTLASVRNDIDAMVGRKKGWLTSAHQGFVEASLRPNCLAAYYNAYLNGADMIETDARFSSDGVLIVNHDPTVTGTNEDGETVTYTIADTPASVLCSVILSSDDKWGVQKVPTLNQVLDLAYHTGLIVNIDLKNGYSAAEPVAKLVLACGMQGKVIYALNGSGIAGINTILAIDPDARFIDGVGFVSAVADFAERGKRCYAYTSDMSDETVNAIRAGGCMLALISLNASNFEAAIAHNPDMCEFLHTSDFRAIENEHFKNVKLY